MSHLAIESNGVRLIGIWGMGGMGKTTLARVVYKMISNQFEACSFISNVREVYEKYGILQLQQTLLNDLLILGDIKVKDVDDGVFMIKNRLRQKKILLVLDDVNELDQLNKLVAKHDWLGLGSRVIITHLLMSYKVDDIYNAEGLSKEEALHLFNSKAFDEEHPPKDYLELCQAFVDYANGLPLAIEVLGSFLYDRSTREWESELNRLKEFPKRKILEVLQISFDKLQETEKEIFLHIAFFLNYINQETITAILDRLELYPKIGLRVLINKSLIKLKDDQLWMHDLLQEMGRDIVRKECHKDPGKRSRLWLYKDIDNVLTKNTGTETIQGIVLNLPEPKVAHWDPESFSKMHHLKFLIIGNIRLNHDPKHLPNDLRFLD
nr:TMV resistance protein N-like [Quercus suber]